MGEIPFFRNLSFSFFEPKYKTARKAVISNAVIFKECSCCVRMHCWIIMKALRCGRKSLKRFDSYVQNICNWIFSLCNPSVTRD